MDAKKERSNCREIIERYYSCFLGADENLFSHYSTGPVALYTPVRNASLQGYGQRCDLLAFATDKTTIISYGDAIREQIPRLMTLLATNGVSLSGAIDKSFNKKPRHSFRYYFSGEAPETNRARLLEPSDYPAFEAFFKSNNPDAKDISWLHDYFDGMVSEKMCGGVFADGRLVSCTDSPTVPFMSGIIKEIGVNTLDGHRDRGFARDACSCVIREILKQGKTPIWSADAQNVPSQKLAESLGFVLWGESFFMSL